MGHTLEENFDRIATALEELAQAQTTIMQTVLHVHLGKPLPEELSIYSRDKGAAHAETSDKQEPACVKTPDKGTLDYDTLKAELIKRGVSVPKGTKMTTLLKWWDKVQDERAAKVEVDAEGEVSESGSFLPKTGAIDEPEQAEASADAASVAEEKKVVSREEARAHLTADYQPTPEWQQLMLSALSAVGATKFSEVADDQMATLVEEFDRLRGEAGL